MPGNWTSEQDLQQLRDEIRALRDEQQREKEELQKLQRDGDDSKSQKNGKGPENSKKSEENEPEDEQKKEEEHKPHPVRNLIIGVVILLVVVIGIVWYFYSRQFESTDDAQVDGHISGIAARVAGTVTGVYVEENQFVKAGQVLLDLDPRDFKTALEQARSQLAEARDQAQAERPNVPVTEVTNRTTVANTASDVAAAEAGVMAAERDYEASQAKIREAEANNAKAQADVERYRPLAEKDEVPQTQFDQVVASAKALAAEVTASQATAAASQRQVAQRQVQLEQARLRADEARRNAPEQIAIRQANVSMRRSATMAASAQVEQALLNLSYCKITTPVDGIVAKRMAEVGEHVTPGQQVVMVTQINDLWVTANYRETQLRRLHAGQSARIHVDSLGADFDGYLESMPAAAGTVTSLLPPENATGNFVKIVQRLPVRVRFKPGQAGLDRLRPGMSVEPTIRVE